MIDLHERLSEFSYGYGVTREVEKLLADTGIQSVPFLPSLVQEKQVGFDVAFAKPGAALMLQFKLGQSLRRFVRTDKAHPAPVLDRPFWRFSVDTSEPDGQFETLLAAEAHGADVYYAAPRFSDWPRYAAAFEASQVLDGSLLITPSEIRAALDAQGAADGPHRIVYDNNRVHVCSRPQRIKEVAPRLLAEKIATQVRSEERSLGFAIKRIFESFFNRNEIRRMPKVENPDFEEDGAVHSLSVRASADLANRERHRRLEDLRERSKSDDDALAAAVGLELWALGIQLVLAVDSDAKE